MIDCSNLPKCVRGRGAADPRGRREAIAPQNLPGELKTAIGMKCLAADRAGFGMGIRGFDQRFHPAGLHLGIVVQQKEEFAAREIAAAVAGAGKAEIKW